MNTDIDFDALQRWVGDPPLQPRERRFAILVQGHLDAGVIPGPTRLNREMGLKTGGNRNMLSGRYSQIRRFMFERAGLQERRYGTGTRYYWPTGDWRYTERPAR